MRLGGGDQLATKATPLSIRIDGQYAEIPTITANLDVDSPGKRRRLRPGCVVVDHEKARVRFLETLANLAFVRPVAKKEMRFDHVRAIDHADERCGIGE